MQQHLHKFLVLYRKLSIPELGSFTIDNESARADNSNALLFPPRPVIHFGVESIPMSDRLFFEFLSEQMGVDEETATKEFHDFSHKLTTDIREHNQALFHGVGRIIRGSDGGLFFTPESNLLELLPPIQLDESFRTIHKKAVNVILPRKLKPEPEPESEKKIIPELIQEPTLQPISQSDIIVEEYEEESETETRSPDRWWIYAIILLVAGTVALLFYYQ